MTERDDNTSLPAGISGVSSHRIDDDASVGMVYEIDYDHPDDSGPLYWHVLSGIDTKELGTPDNPVHLLGVIEESPNSDLDPATVPEGMTHVATYDHPPTEEEKMSLVPEEFKL